MSSEWLNMRFGTYHLQAEGMRFTWRHNPHHVGYPYGRFEIYRLWPFK